MAKLDDIIAAVRATLIAANTAAGSRVDVTRVDPHKKSDIPALSVYALSEEANAEKSSEMEVAYDVALEVAGWAAPTAINGLMAAVSTALRADPYLGGLVSEMELSASSGTTAEVVESNGASDPIVAVAVQTYTVTYHVALSQT